MKRKKEKISYLNDGFLKVSGGHKIYWQEWGNPKGVPVVFLHGGPGGSISDSSTRFFDLKKYRVILFDQRGCGRSQPLFSIKDNTTQDLVNDIEQLRQLLKIDKWVVFGGSWGSALALFYAIAHPKQVMSLILRGIFLGRPFDWDWLINYEGIGQMFPVDYHKFIEIVPKHHLNRIKEWYYNELQSPSKQKRLIAGQHWSQWEQRLLFFNKKVKFHSDPNADYQIALMECHYAINDSFQKDSNYILNNIDKIKNIPTHIIHGQYDYICPPALAYELHQGLNKSKLVYVKNAGHASSEPGIYKALKQSTNFFARKFYQTKLK